jgi:hypothetical protein
MGYDTYWSGELAISPLLAQPAVLVHPFRRRGGDMNILAKRLLWLLLTGAQWWLLALSLHGAAWAWNLFRFLMWTFTALDALLIPVLLLALVLEVKNPKPVPGRTVPWWVNAGSDVAVGLVLAAHGLFLYAGLALAQVALECILWAEMDAFRERQKDDWLVKEDAAA